MSESNSEGDTQKSQEKPSKYTSKKNASSKYAPSYSGGEYETFSGCLIDSEKGEYEVIVKLGQGTFATDA